MRDKPNYQNNEMNFAFLQQTHQQTMHIAEAHKDVLAQFIMQHRADSQLVLHIIKDHIMQKGGGSSPPGPPPAPPTAPGEGARAKRQPPKFDYSALANPPAPPPAHPAPPPAPVPILSVNPGPLLGVLQPEPVKWESCVTTLMSIGGCKSG